MQFNAQKNGIQFLTTRVLDWREIPADVKAFDRVVAADVLYEEHHSTALASVIARTLAHNGVAFVADPCRAKAASFEEACRKVGLDVCKKKARRPLGATDGPAIEIYCVRHLARSR